MWRKKRAFDTIPPSFPPFLRYHSPLSFTFLTLLVLPEADTCLSPVSPWLSGTITVCSCLVPRVCVLIYEGKVRFHYSKTRDNFQSSHVCCFVSRIPGLLLPLEGVAACDVWGTFTCLATKYKSVVSDGRSKTTHVEVKVLHSKYHQFCRKMLSATEILLYMICLLMHQCVSSICCCCRWRWSLF